MWDLFNQDIANRKFDTRKEFEQWVEGWVNEQCSEASRVGGWAVFADEEMAELGVEIGG